MFPARRQRDPTAWLLGVTEPIRAEMVSFGQGLSALTMTGVAVVFGYALLGATWIVMKTEGDLQARVRGWINRCIIFFIICYAVTTMATILVLLVIWRYATRGHRLVDRDIDERIIPALTRVIVIGVTINAIGVLVSYVFPWAGLLSFVAMAFMIVATAYGRYRSVEGRTEVPKQA